MNEQDLKKLSKFLSYVLRHHPEEINLELNAEGWASVDDLIEKSQPRFLLDRALLEQVVAGNDKKRFILDATGQLIRASQGHSVQVNLQLEACIPPPLLYHGTVAKFLDQIRLTGLIKMDRHHVHLSKDHETAVSVGSRRGQPVILTINSGGMAAAGFEFFLSANGVWLTDHVPADYINFPVN